jgi:hypothetical protein
MMSCIGPVERVRRGQLVKPIYDPVFDEFILAIHPQNGASPKPAPCWTECYRESPASTKSALISLGAQVSVNSLGLLLG